VRDVAVEPWIDHIASISTSEQIPGLVGARSVEGQPVKNDIETKAQAAPLAQGGHPTDRVLGSAGDAEDGVRLGQIADQQRIVAPGQEGIEADVVQAEVGRSGEPQLPITIIAQIIKMADARRSQLQTPTRLSHPGRSGRGLQAPAHRVETAEPASGCERMIAIQGLTDD
jgi:hypothetical protein